MDFKYENGILVYYMPAELDHFAADGIKNRSEYIFVNNMVKVLIFDFEKTKFMDSSGIGLVTGRYRRVHDIGGRVFVVNVNFNIDKLLYMSGIYRIITKRTCMQDVINDLKNGGYYE